MVGTITCKEGMNEAMEAVFVDMAKASTEESGVEIYTYLRGEDNKYWFFALMTNQEAMQAHGQTPAMQAAMEAFGPLMAAPPEMSMTVPVAANGFDL